MITGAQIRAARGLLRWSAEVLAERSRLGVATIRRAEASDGLSNLTAANAAAVQAALETAGVIFIVENGDGPGVRLRKAPTMPLAQFLSSLRGYEKDRLQSKGIHRPGGVPKFGFVFVYGDRDFADLMLDGRSLGRVQWQQGGVVFDPPLSHGPRGDAFEDDLDEWVSLAYARGLTRD